MENEDELIMKDWLEFAITIHISEPVKRWWGTEFEEHYYDTFVNVKRSEIIAVLKTEQEGITQLVLSSGQKYFVKKKYEDVMEMV